MQVTPGNSPNVAENCNEIRRRLNIEGLVQGMGFRPHVSRLAKTFSLTGWVRNIETGLQIEIQGEQENVILFIDQVKRQPPALAQLDAITIEPILIKSDHVFEIRQSEYQGKHPARVLPDLATCRTCLDEVNDPANRRYRYPFTSCTECGPRYSIVTSLPYDRDNTTMRPFKQCPHCLSEYETPGDRRFHSQTNACADCGPQLTLLDSQGVALCDGDAALRRANKAIHSGAIVAIKGIGGFQLLANATHDDSIQRLRKLKQRSNKPFALMMKSMNQIRCHATVSLREEVLLSSPHAPIVLLSKKTVENVKVPRLSPLVAPDNPLLGVMLPNTALHHLLLEGISPVVATSGNISSEPIAVENIEAIDALHSLADFILVHDRSIATALDDSVVRFIDKRPTVLRLGRGYAPAFLSLPNTCPPLMALGGHMKSAIAMTDKMGILVGPHIGDLDTPSTRHRFEQSVEHWQTLYKFTPPLLVVDKHPDYHSNRWALASATPTLNVQHHVAHLFACAAENDINGPFTGIAWDGNGMGADGSLWGGECFLADDGGVQRLSHLRTFPLPGGESAIREPRRAAVGLLYELYGADHIRHADEPVLQEFSESERGLLAQMLTRRLNTRVTSSMGRLFDAVAALLGIVQINDFEGQAACALEYASDPQQSGPVYSLPINRADSVLKDTYIHPHMGIDTNSHIHTHDNSPLQDSPRYQCEKPMILDWQPLLINLLADRDAGVPIGAIAMGFHRALAASVVELAQLANEPSVVLSGGCFQNKILTEMAMTQLRAAGFIPYSHNQIPPNDGGLSAGQAYYATRLLTQENYMTLENNQLVKGNGG